MGYFRISGIVRVIYCSVLMISFADAAIPQNYKGKPYKGVLHEIPGRINFIDYDSGGALISFKQDDMAGGPVSGGSTAGSREGDGDKEHPSFFATNRSLWDLDSFYGPGVTWPNGVRYPSSDTSVFHWYIGASHPTDWFNFTVHVSKPGKYWISTIFAAKEVNIKFHLKFMGNKDTIKTPTVTLYPAANSYHAWKQFNDVASVVLDTGIRVLQFYNESYHINQDFLYISADSGKGIQTGIRLSPTLERADASPRISYINRTIAITLPMSGSAAFSILDCAGRICVIQTFKNLAAGTHIIPCNLQLFAKGIYFAELRYNGKQAVTRIYR